MGSVTTFLGRFENNYDGELQEFWQQVFETLPQASQIIDLGTGNGALALLAAEYAASKKLSWHIVGIDSAQIDPSGAVAARCSREILEITNFLSETSIESTGLTASSFDLAMSQFGFEYAKPDEAVAEVCRILNQSGCFVALVHVEGSVLHKQAVDGIAQVDDCLASGLHELLVQLIRRVDVVIRKGKQPINDNKCENLRARVNEITGLLHEKIEEYEEPGQLSFFTERSMAVFQSGFIPRPIDEKLEFLNQVVAETLAYRQRMEDLRAAAQTQEELANLSQSLTRHGLTLQESTRFQIEGHEFCHKLVAQKVT